MTTKAGVCGGMDGGQIEVADFVFFKFIPISFLFEFASFYQKMLGKDIT